MMYRALLIVLIQFEAPNGFILVHRCRLLEHKRCHFIHLLLVFLIAGIMWR